MAVKLDLPFIAASGEAPLLLDANSTTYNLLPVSGGTVYVETYAQKKTNYQELAIGTPSAVRPETYLIKEQNFRDIGGGFWQWERHYAVRPSTWFDREKVAFTTGYRLIVSGTFFAFINSKFATLAQDNGSVLAKATRTYHLESELDALSLNTQAPVYSANATSAPAVFTDVIIREDSLTVYAGKIYERIVYTAPTVTLPQYIVF